ncbi:hypothetical protein DW017_00985 [Ruminococcus sp. AF37-3AC]|nr:hypothetical protein DW017_00985 [Ruminococcus sp. AF37-3AC]
MVKICCDIVKNKLYLIKSTKLCTITCTKKQKCDNELKKQVQKCYNKSNHIAHNYEMEESK